MSIISLSGARSGFGSLSQLSPRAIELIAEADKLDTVNKLSWIGVGVGVLSTLAYFAWKKSTPLIIVGGVGIVGGIAGIMYVKHQSVQLASELAATLPQMWD